MNCVLDAYTAHLCHLCCSENKLDIYLYETIKRLTQSPGYTFGGTVPFIIESMAKTHRLSIKVEHRVWTQTHYMAYAQSNNMNRFAKLAIVLGNFGNEVNKITLEPAIYLMWNSNHAIFSTEVPRKGVPVMAIKLIDKFERRKIYDRAIATTI